MQLTLKLGNKYPILASYIKSQSRVSIIRGPLGSGKTIGSAEFIMRKMVAQKPNKRGQRKTRWVAIRNTFPDLQTTTIKDWLELFEDLGTFKQGGITPPTHYLHFRLPDGTTVSAELIFIALDRPQMVKKLRGLQITGFWLNELKELDKAVVDMADYRHGRYPSRIDGGPSWHGMIGDTNSPDDDHWLFELETITKPDGWTFFTQPGGVLREYVEEDGKLKWTGKWLGNSQAENLGNLPDGYYTNGLSGKTEQWIAVNLANEYGHVHDGQPVYEKQWMDTVHTGETIELIDGHPIIIGLDFGLTPAAAIIQITPLGRLHVLDEVIGHGLGIKQFFESAVIPLLTTKYKNCEWSFCGDPNGSKRSDADDSKTAFGEIDTHFSQYVEPAYSNATNIRLEAVRFFLTGMRAGGPAILVHPSCKYIRQGFNGGYCYKRVQVAGSHRFHIVPDKNKFSHVHDALQYACMMARGNKGPTEDDFEREDTGRWAQ